MAEPTPSQGANPNAHKTNKIQDPNFGKGEIFQISQDEIKRALKDVFQHSVIALPEQCLAKAGLEPNMSDKWTPKKMWIGRLWHLRVLLVAEAQRRLTYGPAIRNGLTVAQLLSRDIPVDSDDPLEAPVSLAALLEHDDAALERAARSAIRVQRLFRRRAMARRRARAPTPALSDAPALLPGSVSMANAAAGVSPPPAMDHPKGLGQALGDSRSRPTSTTKKKSTGPIMSTINPLRKRYTCPSPVDDAELIAILGSDWTYLAKGMSSYHCGSLGLVGDSFRYMRMMCGMGFIVLAPDLTAAPSSASINLRVRQPRRSIVLPDTQTDYWDPFQLFESDDVSGQLVYTSSTELFLEDPMRYSALYGSILTLRQAEMVHILRKLPANVARRGVYLIGSSEGAASLSSMRDHTLGDIILGRVIIGYPCEDTYWTYFRPEDGGIPGCRDVPTLNIMGIHDKYFGRRNSIAATLVDDCDLPEIQGHGYDAMIEAGLACGLVVQLEGAEHAFLKSHDGVVRELLYDFFHRPRGTCKKLPAKWERVPEQAMLIRRYRRHRDRAADSHVLYVRICLPDDACGGGRGAGSVRVHKAPETPPSPLDPVLRRKGCRTVHRGALAGREPPGSRPAIPRGGGRKSDGGFQNGDYDNASGDEDGRSDGGRPR